MASSSRPSSAPISTKTAKLRPITARRRQIPYPKGSVLDTAATLIHRVRARLPRQPRPPHPLRRLPPRLRGYAGSARLQRMFHHRPDRPQEPTSTLGCGGPTLSFPGNFFDNFGKVYQVTPHRTFGPDGAVQLQPWNYQRPDKRYTAGGFAKIDLSNGSGLCRGDGDERYSPGKSAPRATPQTRKRSTAIIRCCPLSRDR